jgi:hypothetical protein
LSKATELNLLYVTPLIIQFGEFESFPPTTAGAMRIANKCSPTLTKFVFVEDVWCVIQISNTLGESHEGSG